MEAMACKRENTHVVWQYAVIEPYDKSAASNCAPRGLHYFFVRPTGNWGQIHLFVSDELALEERLPH